MWISGSPGSASDNSPPHPNHNPPVRFSAFNTPTARPPGAAALRGSDTRFETQINRPAIDTGSHLDSADHAKGSRCPPTAIPHARATLAVGTHLAICERQPHWSVDT